MGSGLTKYSELGKNELLNRLVSKEVLSPEDPFWNTLLSFNNKAPWNKDEWKLLEENSEELIKRFLISNVKTKNFSSLIKVLLLRFSELETSVQTENTVFLWQTTNGLFLIRAVTKFMSENIKEEEMIKQFNDEESSQPLFSSLLNYLVSSLIELPVRDYTYALLLEMTKLMITILSPAILKPGKSAQHMTAWQQLMLGESSVLATPLTCTLLLRYIDQATAPPDLFGDAGGSLVLGFINILTLGYSGTGKPEPPEGYDKPLSECSLSLLLLLVNHFTDPSLLNPYREALVNISSDGTNRQELNKISFVIEFPPLYRTLASTLHTDDPTLLLYLLLLKSSAFRNYVLAATDIDLLFLPILQTLYRAPETNGHLTYMSLIIVLILSEDDLFNQTIHGCILRQNQMSWYAERSFSQLSLGGLVILVVIRTIQYNMLKMRDKYLHTNCLAALANMSSQCTNLHPYVAQRIVSLFETLARKHSHLVEGLRGVTRQEDEAEDEFDEVSDAVQDAAVLEEVLRMLLEIINSCFSHQIQNNPNLVYAVLYKREMFEMYSKNPAFQDLLENIESVLVYMSSRVEQENERRGGYTLTVQEVQDIIREGCKQFPRESLKSMGELKFKYVEEEEPEEFFIPYIWGLTTRFMFWNESMLKT